MKIILKKFNKLLEGSLKVKDKFEKLVAALFTSFIGIFALIISSKLFFLLPLNKRKSESSIILSSA